MILIPPSNEVYGSSWAAKKFRTASMAALYNKFELTANKLSPTIYISSGTIASANCYNGLISNYGQTDDTALTLVTAGAGMSFVVVFGTAVSKYYRVLPAAEDGIYYEGVTQGTGSAHYVGVAATVVGQVIQFISFKTGASTYSWIAMPNFSGLVTP